MFLPQGLTGPKDIDKRISAFKHMYVDEARNTLITEVNFARLDFIYKYTTEGLDLRKNLLTTKDSVFFDWLKKDVVDAKEAKLSRFREQTETMAKRVAFDSMKRTAQFDAIQDDIAMLFDSSSSESSNDADETKAQKQHRARQAQRKHELKKAKRKKVKELAREIEVDKVCQKEEEEEEAFKAETTNRIEDNSLSKVRTMACISFENRIWFNLGMLLWVNHHDCFKEQLRYLQKDLARSLSR